MTPVITLPTGSVARDFMGGSISQMARLDSAVIDSVQWYVAWPADDMGPGVFVHRTSTASGGVPTEAAGKRPLENGRRVS